MSSKKKRNTIVVLSDDDDENDKDFTLISAKSNFTNSTSKPKPSTVVSSGTSSNRAKKARVSNLLRNEAPNPFDEIKYFCEDFGEGFTGFKVPAGRGICNKELWLDKYKPRTLEDLAVHKKKVEEVKLWFEERLRTIKDIVQNQVILISGQAGVGKSATVHAIASHLGATVYEWNTPTPTIWQEHVHASNSGLRYTSKLDEFENFVEKIRKYGIISSTPKGGSQKPVILLIDDLPVMNGKIAYGRLQRCLHLLLQSVHIPTVILVTDYGRADSADYTTRCWEELQSSLQSLGAHKVSFNPITVNSITKTLTKICREEQFKLTTDQISMIAKASGGDIRNAITSLQYFCLKPKPMLPVPSSNGTICPQERPEETNHSDDGFSLPFGRDETLSLFHALGKFLHNKREAPDINSCVKKDSYTVKSKFQRAPLKDTPENVLSQAHGQARPIADFLHENVLDFVQDEGIDDAWVVASYLSDTDRLLSSLNGVLSRNYEADNLIQSTAASVAVRGVHFGNQNPLSSRWHAIRRPTLWNVEQSIWRNKQEMASQRTIPYNGLNISDLSVMATECKPILKWLGPRASEDFESNQVPVEIDMVDDGNFDHKGEFSDDEIEDW